MNNIDVVRIYVINFFVETVVLINPAFHPLIHKSKVSIQCSNSIFEGKSNSITFINKVVLIEKLYIYIS